MSHQANVEAITEDAVSGNTSGKEQNDIPLSKYFHIVFTIKPMFFYIFTENSEDGLLIEAENHFTFLEVPSRSNRKIKKGNENKFFRRYLRKMWHEFTCAQENEQNIQKE